MKALSCLAILAAIIVSGTNSAFAADKGMSQIATDYNIIIQPNAASTKLYIYGKLDAQTRLADLPDISTDTNWPAGAEALKATYAQYINGKGYKFLVWISGGSAWNPQAKIIPVSYACQMVEDTPGANVACVVDIQTFRPEDIHAAENVVKEKLSGSSFAIVPANTLNRGLALPLVAVVDDTNANTNSNLAVKGMSQNETDYSNNIHENPESTAIMFYGKLNDNTGIDDLPDLTLNDLPMEFRIARNEGLLKTVFLDGTTVPKKMLIWMTGRSTWNPEGKDVPVVTDCSINANQGGYVSFGCAIYVQFFTRAENKNATAEEVITNLNGSFFSIRPAATLRFSPYMALRALHQRGGSQVFIVEDTDHDGIGDTKDDCPDKPEDGLGTGSEITDGCPAMDADADGVPDSQDKCPGPKEDGVGEGALKTDGCPSAASAEDTAHVGVSITKGLGGSPEKVAIPTSFLNEGGCTLVAAAEGQAPSLIYIVMSAIALVPVAIRRMR